jgi:hypothetical protein
LLFLLAGTPCKSFFGSPESEPDFTPLLQEETVQLELKGNQEPELKGDLYTEGFQNGFKLVYQFNKEVKVAFDYGISEDYGTTVKRLLSTSGTAYVSNIPAGVYHYQVKLYDAKGTELGTRKGQVEAVDGRSVLLRNEFKTDAETVIADRGSFLNKDGKLFAKYEPKYTVQQRDNRVILKCCGLEKESVS